MAKLTKEELFKKAQERFSSWARMYSNPEVTAEQMYEDMSSSCYTGCMEDDFKNVPVLDKDFCFSYRGYTFVLTSCNNITNRDQIIGTTDENFRERFPYGILTDRYVCWMYGHKDCEGHTKEELENPEFFAPEVYLVNNAWAWGADDDLKPGLEVAQIILTSIDIFLKTFEE